MADYNSLKVPELKKLLQDRNLAVSGNKADLIARLQEADSKPAATAPAAEDEIDWDEDDSKPAEPVAAAAPVAATETAPETAKTEAVAPATETATEAPAAAEDTEAKTETADAPATEAPAAEPAVPKVDYSIGIAQTDAEKEAARREARAKRFGITVPEEEQKKKERAERFGAQSTVAVEGLDSALPERRQKRGREDKQDVRNAKRQTPDRRNGPAPTKNGQKGPAKGTQPAQKKLGILDDPVEKAKAEARAKRFGGA